MSTTTSAQKDQPMAKECMRVENLSKSFGATAVLKDVNFSISAGERIAIVGPSGSGKTTLLRCLNLLEYPSSGNIYFRNGLVGSWPLAHRTKVADLGGHRSRVAMVFQRFELFPHLTARGNITLGPRKVLHTPTAEANRQAEDLLGRVGLASFAEARPRTLSGGQQQRVAIARALAMSPDLILFDEPTSALDSEMVDEVLDLITELARDGTTMIVVTHELGFAREIADRMLVMEAGRIIDQGSPQDLFSRSPDSRTGQILGARRRHGAQSAE